MSQGLCVWDRDFRITICNRRYLEIYGFSPLVVKPGTTMLEMYAHWVELGAGAGKSASLLYLNLINQTGERRQNLRHEDLGDGRTIEIVDRPLDDGGWISEHTDVTVQRRIQSNLQSQNAMLIQREEDLRGQNGCFIAAIENMSHGLSMFDSDERMIVCNGHYIRMFGLDRDIIKPGISLFDVLQNSVNIGIGALSAERLYAERKTFIAGGRPVCYFETLSDGRIIAISHRPMAEGGWVSIYEDITEKQRADEDIREQHRRFDAALANMSQGLLMFDAEPKLIVRNERLLELYGLRAEDVPLGATHRQILEHFVEIGLYEGFDVDRLIESTNASLVAGNHTPVHRELSDGRSIAVSHRPMQGGGWVATFEDVTERRRAEQRIVYMAHHDALTDLATREVFGERLEKALAAMQIGDHSLAVLSVDLDRFKAVNDTLGHPAGDALLRSVADRLRACIREGTDTVARMGGDEFAILQTGLMRQADPADMLAKRIIDAIAQPHIIDGYEVRIGVTIGIALPQGPENNPDQMLKNADLALYQAKREGRNAYRFFTADMAESHQLNRSLEF